MSLPSVFDYIDYRAFLAAWFDARKAEDSAYSYSAFARDAGCSRAALANVIRGDRHPRPATLDAFARGMALTARERNHLGILVDLGAARDARRRFEVMERLLASERYGQLRMAGDEPPIALERYLAHWWVPAIREMVELEGFREDPEWIAATLFPPIEPEQAADALATLLELGFVRRLDDGRLACAEIRIGTAPVLESQALGRFYREEIPRLLRDLDVSRHEEQHFMGAVFALDAASVPEAKARVHRLVTQIATLADSRPRAQPARVYQMAVTLVPLTSTVASSSED